MKKFELTDECSRVSNISVYRIRALRSFYDVKEGDLGGFVQSESNLSHDGSCWVYDGAIVFDDAYVSENARVKDDAVVCGNARVLGRAVVGGNACVCNSAVLDDRAWVEDNALVCNGARVYGDAMVDGRAILSGSACVGDSARVRGNVQLRRNAVVAGTACVCGDARLQDDADVRTDEHYMVIGPIGSRRSYTTFYRNAWGGITVVCGCFVGTIDEFAEAVAKTHGNNRYGIEYGFAMNAAKAHIRHDDREWKGENDGTE